MEKSMDLNAYYEALSEQAKPYFRELRALIHEAHPDVRETLFASQPYFYLPKYETVKFHYRPSVMLTFFKDHLNLFALGNKKYEPELSLYKFTEKHTLQMYYTQPIQNDLLIALFKESLE